MQTEIYTLVNKADGETLCDIGASSQAAANSIARNLFPSLSIDAFLGWRNEYNVCPLFYTYIDKDGLPVETVNR